MPPPAVNLGRPSHLNVLARPPQADNLIAVGQTTKKNCLIKTDASYTTGCKKIPANANESALVFANTGEPISDPNRKLSSQDITPYVPMLSMPEQMAGEEPPPKALKRPDAALARPVKPKSPGLQKQPEVDPLSYLSRISRSLENDFHSLHDEECAVCLFTVRTIVLLLQTMCFWRLFRL